MLLVGDYSNQFCNKSVLLQVLNSDFANRAFLPLRSLHPFLDAQFTEVVHARSGSRGVFHDGDAYGALELTCYLVLELLV